MGFIFGDGGAGDAAKAQADAAEKSAAAQLQGTQTATAEQARQFDISTAAQKDALEKSLAVQNDQFNKTYGLQSDQFNKNLALQKSQYDQSQANLQPWLTTGTAALGKLAALYGIQGRDGAGNPVGGTAPVDPNADFYQSPDYKFQLSQGIKGVDTGASARHMLDSGATRKAEIAYAGNLASGQFNNYAQRLAALAGVGQTATTAANASGQNYADTASNLGSNYASNVGNLNSSYATGLTNAYTGNANQTSSLGSSYGNAISQLAQNQGNNLANIYTNQGNNTANAILASNSAKSGMLGNILGLGLGVDTAGSGSIIGKWLG